LGATAQLKVAVGPQNFQARGKQLGEPVRYNASTNSVAVLVAADVRRRMVRRQSTDPPANERPSVLVDASFPPEPVPKKI